MNIGIYKDVLEGEGWLNEHFLIFFEVAHFSTGQYFLWSFEPSQNASRASTFLLIAKTFPKNIVISINFLEGKDWSNHLFLIFCKIVVFSTFSVLFLEFEALQKDIQGAGIHPEYSGVVSVHQGPRQCCGS